uniref:Protein tweety homolog n=1 Tax=Haemonchus contortus TaxID=6289 RepID=A0A7I4YUF8_HAECO
MQLLTVLLAVGLWRTAVLEETNNAKSLFKSIMEVDRALAEEIKSDISEAKDKKDQLKDQLSQEIKNTVQNLKDALKEKVDKVREIEKAYKEQKSADKKQAYEDWKNLIQGMNQTKVAWEEEKENKIAEVEQEIQQLLNALRLEYEEIKKQRTTQRKEDQEKYRQACQETMEELGCSQGKVNGSSSWGRKHQKGSKKSDYAAIEKRLKQKYAEFMEKREGLKERLKSTLKESLKTTFAMDKLEDVLDKVKAKRQNSVLVEPRATVLDEITGVSAWQTVTWILLALCIIMGVALIAMIVYHVAHHNKYHHLDGSNHPDERTPIARNMGAPGYLGEGKSSPTPMSSGPPPGETQQF